MFFLPSPKIFKFSGFSELLEPVRERVLHERPVASSFCHLVASFKCARFILPINLKNVSLEVNPLNRSEYDSKMRLGWHCKSLFNYL